MTFKRWPLFFVFVIFYFFTYKTVISGTYTNTSFAVVKDGINDSSLEFTNTLQIAVERYVGVKIFGDSIQPSFPATIYPDIISSSADTFSVFYMDTSNDAVNKRDIRIAGGLAPILTAPVKVMDANSPADCYLHADKGESGYLVSVIRKGAGSHRVLRVGNGSSYLDCDSALSTGWMFSSQCLMEKDTFLVMYSSEMNIVKIMKVFSKGSTIQIMQQITVSADTSGGNKLMNCSIASDKKGGVFAVWSRGIPNGTRKLNYRFYGRDLTTIQGGVLNQNIGDNTFYYYDDSPVAALDSMKFAVVHWDSMGIMMNILGISNGSVTHNVSRVISAPGIKFPAIATNEKYCIIACFGDVNGDNYAGIEGLRFDLQNGIPVNPNYYSYSRTINVVPQDRYSIAVNCVLDTAGDFAAIWRYQNRIQGSVWSKRGIRYKNGFWTSGVETLSVNLGDSIRFVPSSISASNTTSWNINSFIRTGSSSTECTNSSWISLNDNTELETTRSVNRYFQYKIVINRNSSGDSINTPSISGITIPYNVQPQIVSLDSVKIGNDDYRHITEDDSIDVLSRSDSVRLMVTVFDRDPSDKVYLKASWPGTGNVQELSGTFPVMATVKFAAAMHDTVAQCTLSVWDSRGWNAKPVLLSYKSRNAVPKLVVSGVFNNAQGIQQTVSIADQQTVFIHETDSLQVHYSVSDPNDTGRVMGYVFLENNNGLAQLDSADQNGTGRFCIHGDTIAPASQYLYHVTVKDNDTSYSYRIYFHVNHSPSIRNITVNDINVVRSDTIKTIIGKLFTVKVSVHDTDCYFGDTLTYRLNAPDTNEMIISTMESASFQWIASIKDSVILITVDDKSGKSDSIFFFQKYPWLETDSQIFNAYSTALDTLSKFVSLIIASGQVDTIIMPLFNNGSDTLLIGSVRPGTMVGKWFKFGIPYDTGLYIMSSNWVESIDTLPIAPAEKRWFYCIFTADSLSGDSVVVDTITITTNDYSHSLVSIPIRLEYNDLPRIVSINPEFSANVPWHLSKSKASEYTFPPHASIGIQFSEPMDTSSLQKGLFIYSRKDSLVKGAEEPIRIKREWSQNSTKLNCFASYDKPSVAFSLFPPESLFIPTDNLAVKLNGNITDKASTPSGPNALDVNLDLRRDDTSDDTITTMKVDSIYFCIVSILPLPYDTQIGVKPIITLSFSSNVYSASVDKSLKENRTLIIRSRYNSGNQLDYDSISVDKNRVSFHIARRLFYCDSLWCRFNSSSIKNSIGFQSDNSKDGIAASMFDTTDTSDDIVWSYRVKNIHILSYIPDDGSTIKEISPAVTINFDDIVDESVIDTDTLNGNRSFKIGSIYESAFSSYRSIEFVKGGKTVLIQPKRKFFSRDSVFILFSGFSRNYRYGYNSNLPGDSLENFGRFTWTFYTGNTGFYTFPNPYKPGKDPRHCNNNGPCGIWFKNLHVLKVGVNDLIVKIYSMNTHPVYNSQKAGDVIHFEENSSEYLPQWLWDTRNQKGELVASGLYFYTVSDLKNKVLTKGKVMIVR
jgi:hypothetical protein